MDETENRILIPSPEGKPLEASGVETEREVHWFPNHAPRHQTKDCWCDPQVDIEFATGRTIFRHRPLLEAYQPLH